MNNKGVCKSKIFKEFKMKKIRKNLITIGIVSIMALSFTACEKDSDDSKLSSYSSKAGSSSGSSNDVDLISKAMQDGDVIFSFDGFTLLDGDVPPTKNDDKSSGAGGSDSKVNSGASNSGDLGSSDNSKAPSGGDGGNTSSSSSSSSSSSDSGKTTRPEYKDIHTLWFDAGLQSDIIFDGEFLLFTFKIKDGAANGTYPISFIKTDIANYGSETISSALVDVKAIDGSITVGGTAQSGEKASGSGFVMAASNESGNPGDEVTVVVTLSNNPGFAGVDLRLQYDSNVLEVVKTSSGKDFKAALGK